MAFERRLHSCDDLNEGIFWGASGGVSGDMSWVESMKRKLGRYEKPFCPNMLVRFVQECCDGAKML